MNQRIKELWIKALRSGEYTQSHHALRTESGYCCLGVLCDLASKEGIGEWITVEGKKIFRLKDGRRMADELPSDVILWAGVSGRNPDTKGGSLARLNDNGATFGEIADIIEQEL